MVGLVIIAKYRGPEFFMALGQCFNHCSKSLMGSLSPPSVHHICWGGGTSGFISQAALPGFGWIFREASRSTSTPPALGGMLIDLRIIPSIKFAATMTWIERGTVRGINIMSSAKARARIPRFGVESTDHQATVSPTIESQTYFLVTTINANKRNVGSAVVSVVALTPVFDEQTDDAFYQ